MVPATAGTAAAPAQHLPPFARDLAADGGAARQSGRVVVVLFSTRGCPYCRQAREAHLAPLAASAEAAATVIVREIEVDSDRAVADFAGAAATHAALGRRYGVRLVPHVAFLGPAGEPLADPLVGIGTLELYGGLLERRIETAAARLRAAPAGVRPPSRGP